MELVNEIVEARNFWEAWMSVRRNKGAAGIDKMSVDVLDVYITKLRKHLKDDDQIEIINIHGKGYKLIVPDAD